MPTLETFLINLDRSPDRLAAASAHLHGLGLPFRRLAAVDGRQVDLSRLPGYDPGDALKAMGRALAPGEIGCYLSHIAAAERIVAEDLPFALVLEDDFAPLPDTARDLEALLEAAASGGLGRWDVVNLGRPAKKFFRPLLTLPSGRGLVRAHYFPVTTSALLWSAEGARQFLRDGRRMRYPVDVFLQSWCSRSGAGLACRPALFATSGADSLVDGGPQATRKAGRASGLGYTRKRLARQAGNYARALTALARGE